MQQHKYLYIYKSKNEKKTLKKILTQRRRAKHHGTLGKIIALRQPQERLKDSLSRDIVHRYIHIFFILLQAPELPIGWSGTSKSDLAEGQILFNERRRGSMSLRGALPPSRGSNTLFTCILFASSDTRIS